MKMKFNKLILLLSLITAPLFCEGAIPTGYYYHLKGKKKAELKSALAGVSTPLFEYDYGSGEGFTWQGFYKTDRNADNTVKDMYSNTVRSFSGFKSIEGMAIEHSFPKSWWGGYENTAYKDLFNLYPADSYTNGIKNNLPLGETTGTLILDNGKTKIGKNGFGTTYTDNCFEPADEFKGDFARSYMYMVSIYENLVQLWNSPMLVNKAYPAWQPWAIDLLLKWSRQDPVSEKERARNDSVYTIQSNRNPFIDHPELAEYIWGNDTTTAFDYPAETGSFLISPRRMTKLDFGILYANTSKSISINLQGVNIASPVTLSFAKQATPFSVSSSSVSVTDVQNGYNVQINYSPTTTGETKDTLLIQGGGLTEITRVPLVGTSTSDFITTDASDLTPVGGTLNWIEDPYATGYKLSLYQGDTKAGNLIISGYYEGASNDKAIEIYNGTGSAVNLSNYSLKKQTNGAGGYVVNYQLSGTLQNNQTYVVVNYASTNADLKAKANAYADSVCAFNGNDAVALFRNGVPVDIVGKLNGGADYVWGLDKILKRNSGVTHPTVKFDSLEWKTYPYSSLEKLGTHTMDFSSQNNFIFKDMVLGKTTSYVLDNLNPNEKYTYSVTSLRSGVAVNSINTSQFKTEELEIPMALDATEINPTSFNANWSESSYSQEYTLDVMKLSGGMVTETENFAQVGSNGLPLPTGWLGTTSGNYTTTASAGLNPPSIAFKSNGEYLTSKQFADTITALNYMYRFPSAGTGSYLKVEMQNKTGWTRIDSILYVNTSKYYPSYKFPRSAGYTAVKFTYGKSSGNFSLDDVAITHGKVDTLYLVKNNMVSALQFKVDNLTASNDYYYRVRAKRGDSYSGYSDMIKVSTLATGVKNVQNHTYKIGLLPNAIAVFRLKGNETIKIFSITGSLIYTVKSSLETMILPFTNHGMYILKIENNNGSEQFKIIK